MYALFARSIMSSKLSDSLLTSCPPSRNEIIFQSAPTSTPSIVGFSNASHIHCCSPGVEAIKASTASIHPMSPCCPTKSNASFNMLVSCLCIAVKTIASGLAPTKLSKLGSALSSSSAYGRRFSLVATGTWCSTSSKNLTDALSP